MMARPGDGLVRTPEMQTNCHALSSSAAASNNATPGPTESPTRPEGILQSWLHFGSDAIAGKKRLIITHSEIFPGTYASTTETADYSAPPMGSYAASRSPLGAHGHADAQRDQSPADLLVVGFAGNSAPDHMDQLQSLPEYLRWLSRK
jgi:hypothetical protein